MGIKTDNVRELKKELEELNGIKVNIQNAKYYYDYFMDQSKSALVEFGVNLGIYLIVYLTLVFQSIFTYLEEKVKSWRLIIFWGFLGSKDILSYLYLIYQVM